MRSGYSEDTLVQQTAEYLEEQLGSELVAGRSQLVIRQGIKFAMHGELTNPDTALLHCVFFPSAPI